MINPTMAPRIFGLVLLSAGFCIVPCYTAMSQSAAAPRWRIYVANDNCPDYTWGFTEEQTRRSFADIVRAHLDEMKRTDRYAPENRDRYNMAVTQEALCFLERYADRKEELIRRIKEGRVFVSPFLCNSLWAFQSIEGAIRTLYPARRLERDWGIPIDVAEHIELPSLPWGMATILAGCGIRWLSVPFYDYDSTFAGLKNPPLFVFEGPDGSRLRVVMDPWLSRKASYTQGAWLLKDPARITSELLPHYRELGGRYPLKDILASGTHGDISPKSGAQARDYVERIRLHNDGGGFGAQLINATLRQFCDVADRTEASAPFLSVMRGCFGHSWDVWPVSLARYVSAAREGEQLFMAAEALLALAMQEQAGLQEATRAGRERAEWCWAMLSDHAWNGTDNANASHNASLRRSWSEELKERGRKLAEQGWNALGLSASGQNLVAFNPLSISRTGLLRLEKPGMGSVVVVSGREVVSQIVAEDGKEMLYCLTPQIPGFGMMLVSIKSGAPQGAREGSLKVEPYSMESPYYAIKVDPKSGGLASLVHKATGTELVTDSGVSLGQTIYYDGTEQTLSDIQSAVIASGPLLARLRITGKISDIRVTMLVTLYSDLDRIDLEFQINKPVSGRQERLCHLFPVRQKRSTLRLETTAAVIRPLPQPEGDLLPGADTRRFAVQGFVDVSSPSEAGISIVPVDAFVLRTDLGTLAFEALGNDQNFKEVVKDQHGQTEFSFRYSLRGHGPGYDAASTVAFSRDVRMPPVVVPGALPAGAALEPGLKLDGSRAIATCWKPAEPDVPGSTILRLQEVGGQSGSLEIDVRGYQRVIQTDLLERNLSELPIKNGRVQLNLRPNGFACIRLMR